MNQYTGYTILELTDEELSDFYGGIFEFPQNLIRNQYVLLSNNGKIVEKICYQEDTYRRIFSPSICDINGNIISGRNLYQDLAIDMLKDRSSKVKLLCGVYGSGKDMLMTAEALRLIDKGKFKKIIFIRPNVTVANVPDIGYLPGDSEEKLAWTLGPLQDKVGGAEKLKTLLSKGSIELMPLLYIRGRSFDDTIVYVTEGQNMTIDIVKLLISRIGEKSELWINGDAKQVDKKIFNQDNGLNKMIEKLSGNPLFSYLWLPITERSDVANLANLLDEEST